MNKKYIDFNWISRTCTLFFMLITNSLLFHACTDDFGEVSPGKSKFLNGSGVFIISEGNYGSGNGSLSFLNFDSLNIYNDIFYAANDRPLGDVPCSMTFIENEIWVVVNNSARIEVMKDSDLSSTDAITGFSSPRFLVKVSNEKAYVSDFYSSEIAILNLKSRQIQGFIPIGRSSEQMVMAGGKVFVAFWSNYGFDGLENNQLMVIDPQTNALTDSLLVGKEPNSMVLDAAGKLWVLCSGGFMAEEFPTLHRINPQSLET
ncbi:MAG: hypothetical protein IH598_02445, partial [Bacteroidales bacterium]|nr:hypothetical protein [Bacteroidales bacterium]